MTSPVLLMLNRPSREAEPHGPGAAAFTSVDPSAAQVTVRDLGVTRGDGIFESISVARGRAQALEPHLARFAVSARMLQLPAPDLDAWREAILAAIDEHDDVAESYIKTVLTRGVEGDGRPTGWVYMEPSADFTKARAEGIRVITLNRGYATTVERELPWLLQGAKTLSYAVNRAAGREAASRGADDVIFVSTDGYLLEGPTANVILRFGDRLVTPPTDIGILAGTTQAGIFAFAEGLGMDTAYELVTPDDLRAADAAWLVSSVRHAAPVRSVDGEDRTVDGEFTTAINTYLLSRRD
ncbi:aminodeoxychorismate lyase [Microbacteriaceae bacterium 4G12]